MQTATLIIIISILGYAEYGSYLILTIIPAFIINGFSDAIKNCIVAFEVKFKEKIRLSVTDLIRKFIILTFISLSVSLIYNFESPTVYWMLISIWALPIIGIGVIATLLKLESRVEQSLFLEIIQPLLNLIIIFFIYISTREIKAENLIISMTFSYLLSFVAIFFRFRNLICNYFSNRHRNKSKLPWKYIVSSLLNSSFLTIIYMVIGQTLRTSDLGMFKVLDKISNVILPLFNVLKSFAANVTHRTRDFKWYEERIHNLQFISIFIMFFYMLAVIIFLRYIPSILQEDIMLSNTDFYILILLFIRIIILITAGPNEQILTMSGYPVFVVATKIITYLTCISIGSQLMFSLENIITNFVCYVFITEVIFLYYVSRYLPYETLIFNRLMRFRKNA